MTAIALVTAGKLRVVQSNMQLTGIAGVAIAAGQVCRLDASTGRFALADGSEVSTATVRGLALRNAAAGEALTVLFNGVVDGFDLETLDYGAPVYLSDTAGGIDDGAGTITAIIGHVEPAFGQTLGNNPDKILHVNVMQVDALSAIVEGALQYTDTDLTAAQIKALKATPVTLVDAPGADRAIVPIAINAVFNYGGTNAFTESADDLSVGYAGGAEIMEIESTGLIDQTNDEWRYITFQHAETFIPEENVAVVLTNLDDEIAGNAANDNTARVRLYYRVVATDL